MNRNSFSFQREWDWWPSQQQQKPRPSRLQASTLMMEMAGMSCSSWRRFWRRNQAQRPIGKRRGEGGERRESADLLTYSSLQTAPRRPAKSKPFVHQRNSSHFSFFNCFFNCIHFYIEIQLRLFAPVVERLVEWMDSPLAVEAAAPSPSLPEAILLKLVTEASSSSNSSRNNNFTLLVACLATHWWNYRE